MKAHEYAFCPECGNKLEGDEFLCPSCGFKLAERPPVAPPPAQQQVPPVAPPPPPVSQPTPPPPPVNQQVPPVAPPPPPVNQQTPPVATPPPPVNKQVPPVVPPPPKPQPQPAPQSQPITYQPSPQQQYVPPKKKSKAWLVILLIVLGVILVGGGVGAFLIYNGTLPKDKVSFLPESVLEMLTPANKKSDSSTTVVAPKQTFYVTYSYGLINNKKVVIISSVMDPANSAKSNEAGAETAFLEFARINYSKDYFHLTKNMTTKTFNDRKKALDERDNIKKDFEKKGYELRLMEVQYSVN
ncbi:MAG TPA: zinc ribbon domain-containing protein [Bacteroidales bacterium]|nr:zinc ribbon domain-containing protein [Bacteroidales bacterium]